MPDILVLLLLSVVATCAVLLLIYGSSRGFDWTDEGYMYLAMTDPSEFECTYRVDYAYSGMLWRLAKYRIARFRKLVLLCNTITQLGLGVSFLVFVQYYLGPLPEIKAVQLIVAIYGIGFLRYVFTREVANHNMMVTFCLTIITSIFFLLSTVAWPWFAISVHFGILAFVGLVCALMVFSKLTSGVVLSCTCALFAVVNSYPSIDLGVTSLLALLIGFAILVAIHHFFIQRLPLLYKRAYYFITLLVENGVPINKMHAIQFKDFCVFLIRSLKIAAPALIFYLALAIFAMLNPSYIHFAATIVAPAFLAINTVTVIILLRLYRCRFFTEIQTPTYFVYFLLIQLSALLTCLTFIYQIQLPYITPYSVLVGFYLVAIPFLVTYGSDNPLTYISNYHLDCPYLLTFLLSIAIDQLVGHSLLSCFIFSASVLVVLSQFFHAYIKHPYRTASLLTQNTRAPVGFGDDWLYVDENIAIFLYRLKTLIFEAGYKPGTSVLMYSVKPGLVFSVGGYAPGIPNLSPTTHRGGNIHNVCLFLMKREDPPRIHSAWLFINRIAADVENFEAYLPELGIQPGKTHILLDTIVCESPMEPEPHVDVKVDTILEVWRPVKDLEVYSRHPLRQSL